MASINITDYTSKIYEASPTDLGQAVSFPDDDSNRYITIDREEPKTEVTQEFWFKTSKADTGLFSHYNTATFGTQTDIYLENGDIYSSVGSENIGTTGLNLADEQWHHVARVFGSSVGGHQLYVDGQLVATGDATEFDGDTDQTRIGSSAHNGFVFFDGVIDEVRLWNTARSADEIQDNLYKTLTGTEEDLAVYYTFEEGSFSSSFNSSIDDLTENNNDGQFNNGRVNSEPSFSFVGHIDLELDEVVTNQPGITVNYQIDSDTTATQDEDFYNSQTDLSTTDDEPQTNSIFIPEGEDSARIYLTALPDEVVEGDESINLTILPDFNKAISFDGSDDNYVDIIDQTNFNNITGAITVEAWIKTDSSSIGSLVTKGADGWRLQGNDSGSGVQFAIGSGSTDALDGDIVVNDGQWHHIAGVYDGTSQTMQLYVDGELDDEKTGVTLSELPTNDSNVQIGGIDGSTGGNFDGEIDEVRIWDTSKTQEEIQDSRYVTLDGDEANLAAYYNFNQDTVDDTTIADVTGNGNDGLLGENKTLSLDGDDDYVNIEDRTDFNNITSAITVEAWIKVDRFDIKWQTIVTTGDSSWRLQRNETTNTVEFAIGTGGTSSTSEISVDGVTNVNDGQWHHVAGVYDSATSTIQLYVDGKLDAQKDNASLSSIPTPYSNVRIGGTGISAVGSRFFDGEIDEVRIWDVARTETEINNYLNTRLDSSQINDNLVAYYSFEDGTADDQSNNSNSGTLNNGASITANNSVPIDSTSTVDLSDSVAYDPFAVNGATYGTETIQSAQVTLKDSGNYAVEVIIANEYGEDLSEADSSLVADADGNATFQVKLKSEPTEDVTVSFSSDNADFGSGNVSATSLTFTPDNWDTYQSLTLSDIDSLLTSETNSSLDLILTFTGGDYDGETQTISAIENDGIIRLAVTEGGTVREIIPTVTFEADASVTEGAAEPGVFTVFLDTPAPEGGLTIPFTVTSDAVEGTDYNLYSDTVTESGVTTNVAKIAEGETSGSITVSKIDNEIPETTTESVSITLESADNYVLSNDTAAIDLIDDDTEGIEIAQLKTVGSLDDSELESLVTLELRSFSETDTGATASFGVSLAQEPTEDVTVTLNDANGSSSEEIAFTTDNWDTPLSVPLTLEDSTGSLELTVDTATSGQTDYSNGNFSVPITTETVATSLDYLGNKLETDESDIADGDSTTIGIRLNTQPTADATVTLSIPDTATDEGQFIDADTQAASQTVTLNFNADNWDSYQEVTLSGVDDSKIDSDIEYSIDVASTNYGDTKDLIPVINYDNEEETTEDVELGNDSDIIASLEVLDSEINEEDGTSADVLQINLSEPAPTENFKVRYTVSGGTATPDVDFDDLGGFVERSDEDNPLSASRNGLTPELEGFLTDFKLTDLDRDGDFDAVIISDYDADFKPRYLKNTGNSALPSFEVQTDTADPFQAIDYGDTSVKGMAFGDLNDDGLPDALVNKSGTLYYLENTTGDSDDNISFADPVETSFSVNNNGTPTLVNIDYDENLELFVGNGDGTVSYYKYEADTSSSLGFTLTENEVGNPLDGIDVGNSAVPNFTDYDSDSDLDVFISSNSGIAYYENTGSEKDPEFVERTGSDNPVNDVNTSSSYPAFVDINNDGDRDLFNARSSNDGITYYENLFYQEATFAAGEQTATADITTIPDDLAEENETIEVSISAKPSQTYSLIVTEAFANGTVGLQINDSDIEALGIAGGSVLTFDNGAVYTVDEDVALFSGTTAQIAGTLNSGTIEVDTTTDYTDEGYRQSANIEAVSELIDDGSGQLSIALRLNETNVSSLTLKEGTDLTFSNGAEITLTSDTAIDTTGTSVDVELSDDSSVSSINSGETTTVNNPSFSSNGIGETEANNTITIVDDEVAGITYTGATDGTTAINTSEASTATETFSVVLDAEPVENVVVYFGTSNSEEGLLSDEAESAGETVKLVFTADDWDTPQNVFVNPVDDDVQDGDTSYEILTTVISDDVIYNEDVVSLVIEEDVVFSSSETTKTVNLLVDDLNVNETNLTAGTQLTFNNGATFTVDENAPLSNTVSTPVNLTLDPSASQINADTTTTITSTYFDEDINQNVTNTFEAIVVSPYDGESGTISIKVTDGSENNILNEGTQVTFDNGAVGEITSFASFASTETKEVDFDLQGYTVTTDEVTQFQEELYNNITVTNTDDDNVGVTVTGSEFATEEGFSNNFFTVQLDSEPLGEVEVTMSPVDADGDKDYNLQLEDEFEGQSRTIIFDETNWNVAQTVEITAVDDNEIEYNHESLISFDITSEDDVDYNSATNAELATPEDVVVKIADNDLPFASIEAIAGAAEASSPGYFVVKLNEPAPDGFDGTGVVVNYAIDTNKATVDIDRLNDTDDLKPLGEYDAATGVVTGSVRIAPGETRTPLIAFPIDDFIAEGVDLKVNSDFAIASSDSSQTLSLIINDDETDEFTIPAGTELSFADGVVLIVQSNVTLVAGTPADVSVALSEGDSATIASDSLTTIEGESVTVSLAEGDEYELSDAISASAIVQDNDKPGVRIVEVEDPTVVNENGTTEFYVSLLSQPIEDVTLELTNPASSIDFDASDYSSTTNEVTLTLNDSDIESVSFSNAIGSLAFYNGDTLLGTAELTDTANNYFTNTTANLEDQTVAFQNPVDADGNSISDFGNVTRVAYEYQELGLNNLTFTSDNWYELQAVTIEGIDDNVVETGDYHTSTIELSVSDDSDSSYTDLEIAPQTVNIIDRTFDTEQTAESLTEGFLALQDAIDSVTLPVVGSLSEVSPSFLEDFLDNIVDEVEATDELTAESLTEAFNTAFNTALGESDFSSDLATPEFAITDLSSDNIEFSLGITGTVDEAIALGSDLGLPALGIGVETDGDLELGFEYDLDLAFGINEDDGFYINTEDTSFGVGAGLGLSEDFEATGNLGFLQLDIGDGDEGTGIDLEFVVSMEDATEEDSSDDLAQLTLSELNSLRQSDNSLFDSINYGFSGDAALDLNLATTVEGDAAFPSFGLNVYSELPLFNYSNTEDEEDISGATVSLNTVTGTLTEDSVGKINITVDSENDSDIRLTKGTELNFTYGDNEQELGSVILQKNYLLGDEDAEIVEVKLAESSPTIDSGDNSSNATADLVSGDFNIAFNDITLDFGTFVTDLINPVVGYVNDLIEPFKPIIDVLQTEVELLDTLGLVSDFDENGDGKASLIEVASTLATTFSSEGNNLKYAQFFDAVSGIIDLVDTVNDLENTISGGDTLNIDFGSYTLESFGAASDDESESAEDYDTDSGTNALNSDTKSAASNVGASSIKTKVNNMFTKLDELGISIPIIEEPLTAINLFLGQDVDLLTYDIPELDIEFGIEEEFPIPGVPAIEGLLEGGFSIYSDLLVGYDTNGLSQWSADDFALADSYKVFDGFYLGDLDPDTGEDVDELTMDATVAAGLSASAVVAKAEVKGGLTGTAGLDIVDGGEYTGDSDGKLRGSEVLDANSLFDLFTLSGSLEAFLEAVVKVGIDAGFFEIMETVWSAEFSKTLFEFELNSSGGTVSQNYVEGATVYFDSNFNGELDEGEPSDVTDAAGNYNFDVPLLFFDTNDNGIIDPEEGRIVNTGGTDTSSGLTLETPLIAPYGSTMVTPLTTLKQKLIEAGSDADVAEAQIETALGLSEVDLENFDSIDAIANGNSLGAEVYQAHVIMQTIFVQTNSLIKQFETTFERATLAESIINEIALGLVDSGTEVDLTNTEQLNSIIVNVLSTEIQAANSSIDTDALDQTLTAFSETLTDSVDYINDAFTDANLDTLIEDIAPVKAIVQGEIADLQGQLGNDSITDEEIAVEVAELLAETALIAIADSSGDADDASILFGTPLSQFGDAEDSDLVRPSYPDTEQYIDITNTGDGTLTISDITINAEGITANLPDGDILLNPDASQRVELTYTPSAANEDFNLEDGMVITSDAVINPELSVALAGKSTFDSDISYDGIVSSGDLGSLNVNWGIEDTDTNWNPTADINGDGIVSSGDLGTLNTEWNQELTSI